MNGTPVSQAGRRRRVRDAERNFEALRGRNLALDMTRGKPSPEQLDLSDGLLTILAAGDGVGVGGDYRNYGLGAGIAEARALFAEMLEVAPDEIVVGGNSSLNLMYDALAGAMLFGVPGGDGPWKDQGPIRFICPVPGYDRHFAICERLGIEMVTVEMTEAGPDMDAVAALAADDPAVKGIWCVPKYSNPTGIVYADAVVEGLAAIETAAADFRIFWDNAYAVHHLGGGPARLINILDACRAAGCEDRPLLFGSTSKMTHAGAGVAMLAGSSANVADATRKMSYATIGPDKINQLRHVRFFGDMAGILAHMERQADLIAPKFAAVDSALEANLTATGYATWTRPRGGYFVSVDVIDGCAAEVVRLAAEAGVKLTPAGATFPYGRDPRDRNLRIAPTLPSVAEIESAMEVFCASVALACARKRAAAAD